eukprot:COSAG06_NODE_8671_length_2070_cov_1.046953_3_plen_53_part_00
MHLSHRHSSNASPLVPNGNDCHRSGAHSCGRSSDTFQELKRNIEERKEESRP